MDSRPWLEIFVHMNFWAGISVGLHAGGWERHLVLGWATYERFLFTISATLAIDVSG